MDPACNVLSNNSNPDTIVNMGFKDTDCLFKSNGWHRVTNKFEHITYTRFGFETEFFEIKLDRDNIYVSVPLKKIPFQYKTSFNSYFLATEYIEEKFLDFISLLHT
jgi:hypothetical protein